MTLALWIVAAIAAVLVNLFGLVYAADRNFEHRQREQQLLNHLGGKKTP